MLFDVHAHLDDEAFDEDRDDVIKKINQQNIGVINAGATLKTSKISVALSKEHENFYACVGIHPHEAGEVPDNYIEILEKLARSSKVVAIGEIGLDYYYELSDKDVQKKVFVEQLELAKKLNLPVVVHNREAHQDTLEILKKSGIKKGLMHCYSGSLEMAEEFMKLGFYFSFGGIITFKNAKRPKEVASKLPLDKILIETDCPYLTPEPYRGKRNDPTNIPIIAKQVAKLQGVSVKELEEKMSQNLKNLFGIIIS